MATKLIDSTRILVTGAAGFLGRELSGLASIGAGNAVLRVGRQAGPFVDQECDCRDQEKLKEILGSFRPDLIFHCAGSFTNSWEQDFANNLEAAREVLLAVKAISPESRVVLFGSAAEYGDSYSGAIKETFKLCPVSVYGLTKAMQTEVMGYFSRKEGLDLCMARLFNLYGAGVSPNLFPGRVSQQIDYVLQGLKTHVNVHSLAGSRDYVHVRAAACQIFRIALRGRSGEVYNVGSGKLTPNAELLRNLMEEAGLPADLVEQENPEAEAKECGYADISKLSQLEEV